MPVANDEAISVEIFGEDLPDAGFFTWDIPGNMLYADGALASLFGLSSEDAGQGLPIEDYLARVHPDDVSHLGKAIRDSIVAHRPQQETYRVLNADGFYRSVTCFGRGFRDREGEPVRYVGIVVPSDEAEVRPRTTH